MPWKEGTTFLRKHRFILTIHTLNILSLCCGRGHASGMEIAADACVAPLEDRSGWPVDKSRSTQVRLTSALVSPCRTGTERVRAVASVGPRASAVSEPLGGVRPFRIFAATRAAHLFEGNERRVGLTVTWLPPPLGKSEPVAASTRYSTNRGGPFNTSVHVDPP
eukprot:scaffold1827_cov421-Prasinococcus_capsulatus_cf.AAC.16